MLVAVDTGGTKTLVASFLKDGSVGKQSKFPTPKDEKEFVTELTREITDILGEATPTAIVIALPGRINPEGVMVEAGNLTWKNFNIRKELASTFDCPILVENDANLAGLAETRVLKTIPPVSLYVTISTGIGTGIIVDGKIDPHFSQSEGGWMMIERDGIIRKWETFASGKAIKKTYGVYAREITSKRVWRQIAANISKGILVLAPVLRPDIIIIGGSIGTFFPEYEDYLKGYLNESLDSVPKIIEAAHPELAVIYGCYYYALDALATA
jgi:predicted NBD/HSP70 family sugar kinase